MNEHNLIAHYKRIIEISQQLTSTYDLPLLLRKIVNAAMELIETEAAAILLLDEASGQLRFAMSTNIKSTEMDAIIVPIEDITQTRHYQGVDDRISFQTRNLLGVPMKTHQRVIGVVQAVNKFGGRFDDDDIMTLQTLATQAALAIENARLFQQSDFIAEMVHELRTPLAALKASTILLTRPDLPESKRGTIVETMKGETERLIELTNDFLDVARLESGRISLSVSEFEIYPLLTECVDIVSQQAIAKNINIGIDEGSDLTVADRGKTKQVLLNLLTNAIKYNRTDGRIHIRLQQVIEDSEPFIQITVADTGYGIPVEHQKNMFQKFFRVPTLENVERGTGLGLAICKHIVEAQGGRIWMDSQEGVGSNFHFTVPLNT